jgi:hypothetical protein
MKYRFVSGREQLLLLACLRDHGAAQAAAIQHAQRLAPDASSLALDRRHDSQSLSPLRIGMGPSSP